MIFKYIYGYLLFSFVVGYGIFITLGAMRKWRSWQNHYRRIDLEAYFGDLGRVLWVLIGLLYSAVGIYAYETKRARSF
jgi:predicted alpha/beta hydrolase